MSRDRVELLLRNVDVPVEPRAEFASALFDRLVRELETPSRAQPKPIGRRDPRLVFALAAAAVVVIVVGVMLVRPGRAAAADVVRRASESITGLSQVHAIVHYDLSPDGARPDMPRGATADVSIDYVRGLGYRQEIVAIDPPLGTIGVGSLVVWDGQRIGYGWYDPRQFIVMPGGQGFDPLRDLGWNSPSRSWEEICTRLGSEVLEAAVIARRPADHLRCGIGSSKWDLWVDQQTGFMLKIRGQLGRDDFKLGTSQAGGFEVTEIDYVTPIDPARFAIVAPPGATLVLAGTPPPTPTPDVVQPSNFAQTGLTRGAVAPSWSGRLIDGSSYRFDSAQGHPTLVLFWAAWCARQEPACDVMRQFDEVSRRYAGRVSFVTVDVGEDPREPQKLMQEMGWRFLVMNDQSMDISKAWGVQAVPIVIALDRDGRVVDGGVGPQTVGRLEEMLRSAGL